MLPFPSRLLNLVQIGATIGLLGLYPLNSLAQITPDTSLGAEPSSLAPFGVIQGGAIRGANLFHSFREFNVRSGESAYFANPAGVDRILSRVTGNTRSQILGTLGVLGTADLFLLNPNGILFGANARLDLRGSFLASTANQVVFSDGLSFSATNPQPVPPLAVSVPIGLQYGRTPPGAIVSQGILVVNSGRSLVLVGGDVTLDRSLIGVRLGQGGRVELGSAAGEGQVGLSQAENQIRLSFPDDLMRGNVTITNDALIQTLSREAGSITIQSRNLNISNGSRLLAGFGVGAGSVNSRAGDITLDATESMWIDGDALIANAVNPNASGRAGDIIITTRSLTVTNGAQIGSTIFGRGRGGDVRIHASDRIILESASTSIPSSLFNTVAPQAVGDGGDTFITTGTLLLNNGGQISSNTFGQGNAGRIAITTRDGVTLSGTGGRRNISSAITSQVATPGIGNGGDIEITARTFSLRQGAQLATSSFGQGNAGNVRVAAQATVTIAGAGSNGNPSGIFSSLEETALGRGGDIQIQAGSLLIANSGAGLFASTIGRGDSGQIGVQTTGDIAVVDRSRILATVEPGAVGNAQGITLQGRSLLVSGGAEVSTNTFGQGNAGRIQIFTTDSVTLTGESSVIGSRSGGISPNAEPVAHQGEIGQGGDIRVTTNQLEISDRALIDARTQTQARGGTITLNANSALLSAGGQLSSTTFSSGQAGDLVLNIRDRLILAGETTGLFANTTAASTGNGGTIFIDPQSVVLRDRTRISVDSQGSGEGGSIQIQADALTLDTNAAISAETVSNTGGNIDLTIKDILLLRRGSTISTTAGTANAGGNGGNININAQFIVAVPAENSDITANAYTGRGGNITIATNAIFGLRSQSRLTPLSDITASSEFGISGSVAITTLNVDPNRGLVPLPTTLVEASRQISQNCTPGSATAARQNSFVISGRGGLPSSPEAVIPGDQPLVDLVALVPTSAYQTQISADKGGGEDSEKIVEAQTWVKSQNGEVYLVAQAEVAAVYKSGLTAPPCWRMNDRRNVP